MTSLGQTLRTTCATLSAGIPTGCENKRLEMTQDLLGNELTSAEIEILDVYERLKAICSQELPPVAESNFRDALAAVWNAVNGLGLAHEHLIDVGL